MFPQNANDLVVSLPVSLEGKEPRWWRNGHTAHHTFPHLQPGHPLGEEGLSENHTGGAPRNPGWPASPASLGMEGPRIEQAPPTQEVSVWASGLGGSRVQTGGKTGFLRDVLFPLSKYGELGVSPEHCQVWNPNQEKPKFRE